MSLEGHEDEGVWVYYGYDHGPYVHSIHCHEIDALRMMNDNGYDRVGYVPFGEDFAKAIGEWEKRRRGEQ